MGRDILSDREEGRAMSRDIHNPSRDLSILWMMIIVIATIICIFYVSSTFFQPDPTMEGYCNGLTWNGTMHDTVLDPTLDECNQGYWCHPGQPCIENGVCSNHWNAVCQCCRSKYGGKVP